MIYLLVNLIRSFIAYASFEVLSMGRLTQPLAHIERETLLCGWSCTDRARFLRQQFNYLSNEGVSSERNALKPFIEFYQVVSYLKI